MDERQYLEQMLRNCDVSIEIAAEIITIQNAKIAVYEGYRTAFSNRLKQLEGSK